MEAPAIRQRMTLSDQLSVLQASSNLRDLLRFRDDDSRSCRSTSTVTLAAVLEAEKNAANIDSSSSAGIGGGRTLLDVIREDEESRVEGNGGSSRWRDLMDRVRIRPAAASTAGSASTTARERSEPEPSISGADRIGSVTVRVSLMTLMELREVGEEGEEERGGDAVMEEADSEVAEVEEEMAGERERNVCCVCMVRRKGAAFIPCGHTFCRICSRELLMERGNCPLCNAAILDVLDIF